ncbi:MAG: hypothetical protein CSA07_03200 [Bacteroidia bacterium]|nr:MAG: hypothetical protein CSA07_03200 [Bacteroidia bacterium]
MAIGLIIVGTLVISCATNRSAISSSSPYADIYYGSSRAKQDSAQAHQARLAREKAQREEQERREKARIAAEKERARRDSLRAEEKLLEPKDFSSYAEYREYIDAHGENTPATASPSAESSPVEQRPIGSSTGSLQGASGSKTVVNNYYLNEPFYTPDYTPPSYSSTRLLMSLEPGFHIRWDIAETIHYRPRYRWVYYPPWPRVYYPIYRPEFYDPWGIPRYDPWYDPWYDGWYEAYPYPRQSTRREPIYRSRQPRMNQESFRRPSTNSGYGTRGGGGYQEGSVHRRTPSTRGSQYPSDDFAPVRHRGQSSGQDWETTRTRRPTQSRTYPSDDFAPVRHRDESSSSRSHRDTASAPTRYRSSDDDFAPVRHR